MMRLVVISAVLGSILKFNNKIIWILNYLNFVEFHSDLGITIERFLKYHSHITKFVGCMNGLTSNLLDCILCRDENFLINIYTSHVRLKLGYASPLCGYFGNLRLLEREEMDSCCSGLGRKILSWMIFSKGSSSSYWPDIIMEDCPQAMCNRIWWNINI